uniref:Uncharacterized protein n=1 Tax=viral metagenome TaxID=1070528 RepID=A0A6M3K1C1_9ZZZZ
MENGWTEKIRELEAEIAELRQDAGRYRKVRIMTVADFQKIWQRNLDGSQERKTFDELVDKMWKENHYEQPADRGIIQTTGE